MKITCNECKQEIFPEDSHCMVTNEDGDAFCNDDCAITWQTDNNDAYDYYVDDYVL